MNELIPQPEHKNLLSMYYVLGIVLGHEESAVSKKNKAPIFVGLPYIRGETDTDTETKNYQILVSPTGVLK